MEMYKCPKCGTEFLLGTKFCENCGCNLEVEFIETPICPKCKKTYPTGTLFCSDDGIKLVSPEKMIPKCVKCGQVYTDDTKFCSKCGGKVIPEVLRTAIDFDRGKELIADNIGKGKKLFDNLSKNQKIGLIGGCIAIIVLVIVLTGGSPGKKAAKAYCKCCEIELKKDINDRDEREIFRCFKKKTEKYWKHMGTVGYDYDITFKNPKHQREFEEAVEKGMKKLQEKYNY